jgi:hypothetical protein
MSDYYLKVCKIKVVFVMSFLLLFIGCEDSGLYTKFYQKDIVLHNVKEIKLEGDNYYILDRVENSLKKSGFTIVKNSKYKIKVYSHYVISCTNPVMHAIPADFNGYIGLYFYNGKDKIYRVQKDFRGKINSSIVDEVVKKMIDDLKLTREE